MKSYSVLSALPPPPLKNENMPSCVQPHNNLSPYLAQIDLVRTFQLNVKIQATGGLPGAEKRLSYHQAFSSRPCV